MSFRKQEGEKSLTLRELLEEQYGPGVVATFPCAEGVDLDGVIRESESSLLEEGERFTAPENSSQRVA